MRFLKIVLRSQLSSLCFTEVLEDPTLLLDTQATPDPEAAPSAPEVHLKVT